MTEPERYLLRFRGGPDDGHDFVATDGFSLVNNWGTWLVEWPLPERLNDSGGGYYEKVSESQLPAGLAHVLRGAEYVWHEAATP